MEKYYYLVAFLLLDLSTREGAADHKNQYHKWKEFVMVQQCDWFGVKEIFVLHGDK